MKNQLISFAKPMLGKEEKSQVKEILNGPILTHGPKCRSFENKFGTFHGGINAVTLANCTSAMFLALKAQGIGEGDEVIVPAMTHIATAHCVSHTGAKVIFCDVELKTGNIDCKLIENKITKKTKAIIVVHFVGLPADMDLINKIAKKFSLFVIEDCAAALGAKYNKKLVGTLSNVGCYSFYPTKHITTMEGGMLISKSLKLTNKIRKLSSFGYYKTLQERNVPGIYDVDLLGYNLRMSEVAAGIGIEQIKKAKNFIKIRKQNSIKIRALLKKVEGITILPIKSNKSESSNFCVNIVLDKKFSKIRNNLILNLKSRNLGTSVHYPICLPYSKFYKNNKKNKNNNQYSAADHLAKSIISLPCGPHINKDQSSKVAKIFIDCFEEMKNEK